MKSPCVTFVNVVLLISVRTRSRVWPLLWVGKVTWFCRLKRSKKSPGVCASCVLMVSDLMLKSPNINSSFVDVILLSMTLLRSSKNAKNFLQSIDIIHAQQVAFDSHWFWIVNILYQWIQKRSCLPMWQSSYCIWVLYLHLFFHLDGTLMICHVLLEQLLSLIPQWNPYVSIIQ